MTAKTSPARIAAFFRALEETGNQTIAAERARVSRSWMSLHRATDPAFRARMEAAIDVAKARLRERATSVAPDDKWRAEAGRSWLCAAPTGGGRRSRARGSANGRHAPRRAS